MQIETSTKKVQEKTKPSLLSVFKRVFKAKLCLKKNVLLWHKLSYYQI